MGFPLCRWTLIFHFKLVIKHIWYLPLVQTLEILENFSLTCFPITWNSNRIPLCNRRNDRGISGKVSFSYTEISSSFESPWDTTTHLQLIRRDNSLNSYDNSCVLTISPSMFFRYICVLLLPLLAVEIQCQSKWFFIHCVHCK